MVLAVLALGDLWFNSTESERAEEAENRRAELDRELADDCAMEAALQSYLDRMTELILEEDLIRSDVFVHVRDVARARTLALLGQLDWNRKLGYTTPGDDGVSLSGEAPSVRTLGQN